MCSERQTVVQTRQLVLCYGIRHGPVANWDYLKTLLIPLTTTTSMNKLSLLRGMACSRNEDQLDEYETFNAVQLVFSLQQKISRKEKRNNESPLRSRLLQMTINGTVRTQDSSAVFAYLNRFLLGHTTAWDFLQQKWSHKNLGRK